MAFKKNAAHYMALPYTYTISSEPEEAGYFIKVNELPGCFSQGRTPDEALIRIREAMAVWIEGQIDDGDPVPVPDEKKEFSGKFVARFPKSLHRKLALTAAAEDVPMNLLLNTVLARFFAAEHEPGYLKPDISSLADSLGIGAIPEGHGKSFRKGMADVFLQSALDETRTSAVPRGHEASYRRGRTFAEALIKEINGRVKHPNKPIEAIAG